MLFGQSPSQLQHGRSSAVGIIYLIASWPKDNWLRMTSRNYRKLALGLLTGILLLSALFLWQGIGNVVQLFVQGGPAIAAVCLFTPGEQWLAAEAWRILFQPGRRPSRLSSVIASWMGSAVNSLLPVAGIGGEVVKARVLIRREANEDTTLASLLVDKTAQAITVFIWGLVGVCLLAMTVDDMRFVFGALAGAGLLGIGIGIFVFLQVTGKLGAATQRLLEVAGVSKNASILNRIGNIDNSVRDSYADRRRVAAAVLLRLTQRVFLAGEVVLVGHLVGLPIGFADAIALKGIVGAVRGAGFAIPAGLGIQEGGFIAIGALLGYPPDLMLAVSLATRIREILPSIPALIWWQAAEAKAVLRNKAHLKRNSPGEG